MPLFLQRLYNIFSDGTKCRQDDGGAEDLELGRCLQSAGVIPVDSRYYMCLMTHCIVCACLLKVLYVPYDSLYCMCLLT